MAFRNRFEFYRSTEWNEFRQRVILQRQSEQGAVICEECKKAIVKKYDTILHHVKPLNDTNIFDYNISLNPDNIQIVCFKCHNKLENRWQGTISKGQRKVYIVHGAICSGKSTFVKENMQKGDLIYDIDLLWQAISGQPKYIKPDTLKELIFPLELELKKQIQMRAGNWLNAWVMSTDKFSTSLNRLAKELNAEIIHIDTDKETCIARLEADPQERDVKVYKALIEDYFNYWKD